MLKKVMMLCLVLFSQQVISSDSKASLQSSNKNEQECQYHENSARAVFMRSCGGDRSEQVIPSYQLDVHRVWDGSLWNHAAQWAGYTSSSDSTALSGFGPTWSDPTSLSCYDFSSQAPTPKRLSCELTELGLSLLRQAMEKEKIAQKNRLSSSDDIE